RGGGSAAAPGRLRRRPRVRRRRHGDDRAAQVSERSRRAKTGPADGKVAADRWLLLLVLLVAAALRLFRLDGVPPGINQDEALSAWNGWCLLKTGHALSGEPWPISHCRNIGDSPTMLFFYILMPSQRCFGLSVWSPRLPAALAGIAAVA